ncbi:MAG: choice-of-anchor J domain-containing protein [Candidatus Cloacimonetes bacterium]|jgi:hypothetical protein|nr:choice-of-anchor J domain-containing protein [Candidatus Cloacimonadota bacterium]
MKKLILLISVLVLALGLFAAEVVIATGADCPAWSLTTKEDPTITSFPWAENFDAVTAPNLPAGWLSIDNNEDGDMWISYVENPKSSPNAVTLYTDHNTNNDDYLVTPPLALTGNQRLKFWTRSQSINANDIDEISVLLSTTTPTAAAFTNVLLPSTSVNFTAYREYIVDLSAYSGTCYISFTRKDEPADGWRLYIDDVSIEEIPATPIFAYTPESMEFGSTAANVQTEYQNVTVSNTGSLILNLTNADLSLSGTDPTQFEFSATDFPAALAAYESVSIPVRFAPTSDGAKTATFSISYAGTDYDVSLAGYAYLENSLVESFEAGVIPANWTVINADGGTNSWVASDTNPHTGNYSARIGFETSALNNDDWLITPPLQVTSATTDEISFWMRSHSSFYEDPWQVLISTTNTNPASFTMIDSGPGALGAYIEKSYNLDSYGDAVVYLAVRYLGTYDWSLYVDDFVGPPIYFAPFPPSAVTMDYPAVNATMQPRAGFNFAWTAGETDGIPTTYSFYLATSEASIQSEFSVDELTAAACNPVGKPYGAGTFSFDTWGQRWYWQVEAHNAYGSTLSEIRWFEIQPDPTITTFPWSEGFESYADFSTKLTPWTTMDLDGSTTYGFNGTTFPGMGTPMSYIVFNPETTTPAVDSGDALPHSGDKFAACFASENAVNNDWLITPPFVAQAGLHFSFWAKTYQDYGLEEFNVAVSISGMAPEDFFVISGTSPIAAPQDWTEYSYDLSVLDGHTMYMAIQCVSDDAFIFMVDDVLLGMPIAELDAPVVSIAADGTLSWAPISGAAAYLISKSTDPEGTFTYVAALLGTESSWLDPAFGADKMFYQVQASTGAPTKNVAIRKNSTEVPSDPRADKALKKPADFKK